MATQQDLNTISSDLSALKRDFATLLHDLRAGPLTNARIAAQDRAGQLGKRADRIAHQAGDRPLLTLLAAFSVGFIASRLLPR